MCIASGGCYVLVWIKLLFKLYQLIHKFFPPVAAGFRIFVFLLDFKFHLADNFTATHFEPRFCEIHACDIDAICFVVFLRVLVIAQPEIAGGAVIRRSVHFLCLERSSWMRHFVGRAQTNDAGERGLAVLDLECYIAIWARNDHSNWRLFVVVLRKVEARVWINDRIKKLLK